MPHLVKLQDVEEALLLAELQRRKEERTRNEKPRPLAQPDFSAVEKLAKEYIERLAEPNEDYDPEDAGTYIFEEVIEAVFGDVWEWIRSRV